MNNKVTLQDLAEQLSNISGQSKKLSESFLRALTEIIEDSLEKDGIAKVKGIGTFKTIAIEERKSVSVTDGSTVIIPAHKKITFTPEKELKEAVNKPYEHLETYILPNDGPVDAPVSDDEEEEGYLEEEVAVASAITAATIGNVAANNAGEIVSEEPISAINSFAPQEEPSNLEPFNMEVEPKTKDAAEEPIAAEEQPAAIAPTQEPEAFAQEAVQQPAEQVSVQESVQEPIQQTPTPSTEAPIQEAVSAEMPAATDDAVVEEAKGEEKIEEMVETTEAPAAETTAENTAENTDAPEATATEEQPASTEPETAPAAETEAEKPVASDNNETKKKSKKSLLWVIIILALLVLACIIFALSKTPAFKNQFDGIKERITQMIGGEQQTPAVTPVPADTTQVTEEPENNESEAFFPEEGETETTEQEAEFAEEPVKEVNYDWFEKEFKNFVKKEHPKIKVEVLGEPIIDTIKAGKTLTAMSRKYYNGGKDFWVYIYLYNKDVIRRPDNVPAGTVIKIPQLHPSMVNPSSYESVNAAKDVKESYLRLFN